MLLSTKQKNSSAYVMLIQNPSSLLTAGIDGLQFNELCLSFSSWVLVRTRGVFSRRMEGEEETVEAVHFLLINSAHEGGAFTPLQFLHPHPALTQFINRTGKFELIKAYYYHYLHFYTVALLSPGLCSVLV